MDLIANQLQELGFRRMESKSLKRKSAPEPYRLGQYLNRVQRRRHVWQSKDGKHEIRQWTDSLRKLVRKELERSKSDWVFTNRSGQPWSMSANQSAMRRLEVSWTFRDLRAKADSDHQTGLGLMRRYNRARRLRAVK